MDAGQDNDDVVEEIVKKEKVVSAKVKEPILKSIVSLQENMLFEGLERFNSPSSTERRLVLEEEEKMQEQQQVKAQLSQNVKQLYKTKKQVGEQRDEIQDKLAGWGQAQKPQLLREVDEEGFVLP